MAKLPSYFDDFLVKIRMTENQIDECKTGHTTLRERLQKDDSLAPIIVGSFLQGSYKRATAIRPSEETKKSDVDIVVVTAIDRNKETPAQALERFRPFLEKHYKGKFNLQGRSWHVELSYVEMDLVPTSAPSKVVEELVKSFSVTMTESIDEMKDWRLGRYWKPGGGQLNKAMTLSEAAAEEQWRKEPLWIPDRDAAKWDETHPLAQLAGTAAKNARCNTHFVNVVKCLKWWRLTQKPTPKYPKSYPLEHLLWVNCPDGIDTIAEGVVTSLESIRDQYRVQALLKTTPTIPDHGVPSHNVLGRVSGKDFAAFHGIVTEAAGVARRAYDEQDARKSAMLWRELFGEKFPEPPDRGGETPKDGGFTPRAKVSIVGTGRFA